MCPVFPTVAGRGNHILATAFLSIMGNNITESFKKDMGWSCWKKKALSKEKKITLSTKRQGLSSLSIIPPTFSLRRKRLGKKRNVNVCLALRERSMGKVVHAVLLP